MELPFDRVGVTTGGVTRWLSGRDFMALPLDERLAALFEGRVEFYSVDNTRLEPHHALRAVRENALVDGTS